MLPLAAVDPELLPLLDAWQQFELSDEVLERVRQRELPLPASDEDGVTHTTRSVPGSAGAPDVTLHIYQPAGERVRGCIYHIHGGGYVVGKARDLEAMHRPLARSLDCVIVSVDYRLAPETPFPGPIEDCLAGLLWVQANIATLGIDPARIGLMGESAGGGLAAALSLLMRDRGHPPIAFQCLTYPMIDDRTCVTSAPNPKTGAFIWTPHNNHYGWRALLGQPPGSSGISCYAAAARATDLRDLPPTFIMVGTLDLFLDENIDFVARLNRVGVPCEFHVYPGAFHGFDFAAEAKVAIRARAERSAFLMRALHV